MRTSTIPTQFSKRQLLCGVPKKQNSQNSPTEIQRTRIGSYSLSVRVLCATQTNQLYCLIFDLYLVDTTLFIWRIIPARKPKKKKPQTQTEGTFQPPKILNPATGGYEYEWISTKFVTILNFIPAIIRIRSHSRRYVVLPHVTCVCGVLCCCSDCVRT